MDKEHKAIMRLQEASQMSLSYYKQPLLLTDSGGKDSAVCLALAARAGIPYEVSHSHTSVDAPETVYHVRETFRRLELEGVKCTVDYPTHQGRRETMWTLIPRKQFPPTRLIRFCCVKLKETAGGGEIYSNRRSLGGIDPAQEHTRHLRNTLPPQGKQNRPE